MRPHNKAEQHASRTAELQPSAAIPNQQQSTLPTEVGNFDVVALVHEDVLGFEVSMDDAPGKHGGNASMQGQACTHHRTLAQGMPKKIHAKAQGKPQKSMPNCFFPGKEKGPHAALTHAPPRAKRVLHLCILCIPSMSIVVLAFSSCLTSQYRGAHMLWW